MSEWDILDDIVDTLEEGGVILLGSGSDGYDSTTMTGPTIDVILADGRNATIMINVH